MSVTLDHPSRTYLPGDAPGCPTCGREGGTPGIVHGGEAPDGTPDLSLAGLRCVAESLARTLAPYLQSGAQDVVGDAAYSAAWLADVLAGLDEQAGGLPAAYTLPERTP